MSETTIPEAIRGRIVEDLATFLVIDGIDDPTLAEFVREEADDSAESMERFWGLLHPVEQDEILRCLGCEQGDPEGGDDS